MQVFIDDSGNASFNDPNNNSLGINAIALDDEQVDGLRKMLTDLLKKLKRESKHFKWSKTSKRAFKARVDNYLVNKLASFS